MKKLLEFRFTKFSLLTQFDCSADHSDRKSKTRAGFYFDLESEEITCLTKILDLALAHTNFVRTWVSHNTIKKICTIIFLEAQTEFALKSLGAT